MKKVVIVLLALILLSGLIAVPVLAGENGGINDPPGVELYVIIEVNWDGKSANGDWTVWGPKWDPVVGTGTELASCTDCLDMTNYEFIISGKTLQFDEVMVEGVVATPQSHHVILMDKDGDGVYTGSLNASHYFPWRPTDPAITYFDRIDYWVTVESGEVTDFYYLQYEHKKLPEE